MKLILVIVGLTATLAGAGLWWLGRQFNNHSDIGIFKMYGCLRDDEMGVTYQYVSNQKGRPIFKVVFSEKYPTSETYGVGKFMRGSANANPLKLYAVPCPATD